ncbi:OsmC family protein [bacterium]|nr:OsmC family protein [bacterium]
MKYQISGSSDAHGKAVFSVRENETFFGIVANKNQLPNPAELLLGAFAACCLKNIERFSNLLKFDYENAQIEVVGERQDAPPKMKAIRYTIQIKSQDERLNVALLHKNIQKYGTIYNTLKETCEISGEAKIFKDYV